jgi:hypothetical protein
MLTSAVVYLTLLLWIPVCTGLFAVARPARACALAYVVGWLFLPMLSIPIDGFWDIDKIIATNAGVFLGILIFCPNPLMGFRPTAADVILVVFAVGTMVTSVTNDLGIHDGLSEMGRKIFYYAVPFFAGRCLLRTREDLREACRVVVGAAAVYGLLAVWEWRMSPSLHVNLYGVFQHSWNQHFRSGAWRPILFLPHGLAVGSFFAWTAILAIWLWRTGQLRSLAGIPAGWIAPLPLLGLVASMSMGPWGLFLAGCGLLLWWRRTGLRRAVLVPAAFAMLWIGGRYTSIMDGQWLAAAAANVSEDRADSLQYRIEAETLLIDRAKEQPIFGWGSWGRNRAKDEAGNDLTATDGLWIIYTGAYGLVGLVTFYLWWCWPLWMSQRCSRVLEADAALMVLLIAIGQEAVNMLFNGFLSPILTLLSGGVVTSLALLRRRRGILVNAK